MAVIESAVTGDLQGVGVESASPAHSTLKPVPVGVLGHYHTSHRMAIVNSQAANSKLFEIQNASATNLVVITGIRITVVQTGAHTAAIEDSFDVYRTTGHSVISTTNTVTPVIGKMRTSFATAGLNVRGGTVAGVAAGMTGFTLTKDTAPLYQVPIFFLATNPTAGPVPYAERDWRPGVGVSGEHPLVLVQNEGIVIDNRVALGAAAGATFYVDLAWSEVAAY